jgi:hypothetical protein
MPAVGGPSKTTVHSPGGKRGRCRHVILLRSQDAGHVKNPACPGGAPHPAVVKAPQS